MHRTSIFQTKKVSPINICPSILCHGKNAQVVKRRWAQLSVFLPGDVKTQEAEKSLRNVACVAFIISRCLKPGQL